MNDDKLYDVDLSQLETSIDTEQVFSKEELPSINLMNSFLNSKHELKNHNRSLSTRNLFIEFEIKVNGQVVPSGISTSTAEFWTMTFGNTLLSFPTEFIRDVVNRRNELTFWIKEVNNADNYVGKGIVIPIEDILGLYVDYEYQLGRKRALNFTSK